MLERGSVLRGGDRLRTDDGRVVRVVAADEALMEARCDDPDQLARCAFHLGNRHTPVEVRAGALRFAADDVLAGMLRGLGARVARDHRAVRARSRRVRRRPPPSFRRREAHRHHPRHDRAHADEGMMRDALALVRLLQLASPALPIGAYSYSQGLEWCVEAGTIRDAGAAQAWIGELLREVQARGEAPVLWRLCATAARGDWRGLRTLARVVPRVARELGAAGRDAADGRLARAAAGRSRRARRSRARGAGAHCACHIACRVRAGRACDAGSGAGRVDRVSVVVAREPGARGHEDDSAGPGGGTEDAARAGRCDPGGGCRCAADRRRRCRELRAGSRLASARHETQYSRLFRSWMHPPPD